MCRELEALALLVSSLCHDVDHRGTTNSFQLASNSVLAALYSSEGSVMEVHNFCLEWNPNNSPQHNRFLAPPFRTDHVHPQYGRLQYFWKFIVTRLHALLRFGTRHHPWYVLCFSSLLSNTQLKRDCLTQQPQICPTICAFSKGWKISLVPVTIRTTPSTTKCFFSSSWLPLICLIRPKTGRVLGTQRCVKSDHLSPIRIDV